MNEVNKTLYIPLYGKSYVSKKGIILQDKKAEEIWSSEGFRLTGKAKSKWLAYYMGMRSAVFDRWLIQTMRQLPDAVILHIGCGLDSRAERVGTSGHIWYDIDFPEVIKERKKYFQECEEYRMIGTDVRNHDWLKQLHNSTSAIVIMEGVSMYMTHTELSGLFNRITSKYSQVLVFMDCYTTFAAKASKYKNPINEVGVTVVHGIDDPRSLESTTNLLYIKEHNITPDHMIDQLSGIERLIFKNVFAGRFAKKMYRLFEFCSN